MARHLGTLLCFLVLGCCFALPASAAGLSEKEAAGEKEIAQTRAGLMERDPEFAAAESAFEAAREKFLALFSGPSLNWAKALLKAHTEDQGYSITRLADEQHKLYRGNFLAKRAFLTRYMTLVTETPFTDPKFLLLLRPVCLHADRNPDSSVLVKTLNEHDAAWKKPAPAESRRTNAEYWGLIRFTSQKVASADGPDVNLAFVLRVSGGAFSLHPIIAPSIDAYWPGEDLPLRPTDRKPDLGPKKERIADCAMVSKLSLTNSNGIFAFRADAEQLFDGEQFSYMCEPKCTGFAYTWSDKSKTFLRGPGECREDDGWRAKSPFAGETLIPVAEYAGELTGSSAALRANEEAVDAAWKAFYSLFDEKTGQRLKAEYDAWRYDRQIALYRFVGKADEFEKAALDGDKAVLEFMQRAAVLAAKPDARLLVLLDSLHKKMTAPPKSDKSRSGRDEEDGGYYYRSELLSGKKQPVLTTRFAKQLTLLSPPAPPRKTDRYDSAPAYAATGLEGGPAITFSFENPLNASRGSKEKLPGKVDAFTMTQGADSSHWGLTERQADPSRRRYYNDEQGDEARITLIRAGKIFFVTPALPEEKAFFKQPELRRDKVVWTYPRTDRRYYYGECEMRPAFTVDASKAPFGLTAVDRQFSDRFAQDERWVCIPECSIPFVWNGSAYLPGDPVCLPEGEWGVKEPAPKKKQ